MSDPVDIATATRSLVDVSEAFIEIAATLRKLPDVSVIESHLMRRETRLGENQFTVGKGPGFRLVWYADAMFADGPSLSFSEEVSWHEGEWTIEAAVTLIFENDQEPIIELPARHAVDPVDFVVELELQTRMLLDSRDSAIRLFSER